MALAELMNKNHLKTVVSQNVDGLHRKSGIPAHNIAELHGNINVEICEVCGREYLRDVRVRVAKSVTEHRTGRMCESERCRGHLKDTAINFGEQLNPAILAMGEQSCAAADLCLAMGSSLTVTPAAAAGSTHLREPSPQVATSAPSARTKRPPGAATLVGR